MHQRLPSKHQPASPSAAQPPRFHQGRRSEDLWRAPAIQIVADSNAASAALRTRRMDDAPQFTSALWHGTRRNRARSHARLESEAYSRAAAPSVVPTAMEERAGKD